MSALSRSVTFLGEAIRGGQFLNSPDTARASTRGNGRSNPWADQESPSKPHRGSKIIVKVCLGFCTHVRVRLTLGRDGGGSTWRAKVG